MFLSLMVVILMVKVVLVNSMHRLFNMMKVYSLYDHFIIESLELRNQILPYTRQKSRKIFDSKPLLISTEKDFPKLAEKHWTSISIAQNTFRTLERDIDFSNFLHVQYICIQTNSFQHIKTLSISDLPNLRVIVTENYSCHKTESATIASLFLKKMIIQ